ncbi:hypothetical protein BDR04DRAFT_1137842 [Suillus decipiens]|nr:hypothetical protein BDR04DRAFT_1137842 [Suillus decipiens]
MYREEGLRESWCTKYENKNVGDSRAEARILSEASSTAEANIPLSTLRKSFIKIFKRQRHEELSIKVKEPHRGQLGQQCMQLTGHQDGINYRRNPHKKCRDLLIGNGLRKRLAVSVHWTCAKRHCNFAQAPAMMYEVDKSYKGERWRNEPTSRTSKPKILEVWP